MFAVSLATLLSLLLFASVIAIVSRRLKLPYTVGLAIGGLALALLPPHLEPKLTRDLIFTILLPPLIFEAALQMRWRPFRFNLPITLTMAFPGTLIAATVVAVGMHVFAGWSGIGCALFGILIAATDPVAIVAWFKETRTDQRLRYLVESESLLNDGAAAVGFSIVSGLAVGAPPTAGAMLLDCAWTTLGGALIGLVLAAALLLLAGRTSDRLVEVTLTTVAAYGSFLIAEQLGASGVLASMSAGLLIGNRTAPRGISSDGRNAAVVFWEYAAFLANSIVFLLIGAQIAHEGPNLWSTAAAAAIALVLIGRAAAVYPVCAIFSRSRLRVEYSKQHVLVWAGLKGALGLALVLAIPTQVAERQAIIQVTFAVVAFSVFVQTLTMPRLVRALHLDRGESS